MTKSTIIITGAIGLLGAMLTGAGEFILHYDALSRFSENQFFLGISAERSSWGHFIGVLGAPLYLVGCWHIYLMLRPANPRWSLIAFFTMGYGFLVGIVWIGSRAKYLMPIAIKLGAFRVLGAPLYLVGCWHIYLMLRPANPRWSLASLLKNHVLDSWSGSSGSGRARAIRISARSSTRRDRRRSSN